MLDDINSSQIWIDVLPGLIIGVLSGLAIVILGVILFKRGLMESKKINDKRNSLRQEMEAMIK